MPIQQDNQPSEELGELNAELTQSIERCRALLSDCREKLAANSNDVAQARDEAGSRSA